MPLAAPLRSATDDRRRGGVRPRVPRRHPPVAPAGPFWSADRWLPFTLAIVTLAVAGALPESGVLLAHDPARADRHGGTDPARARCADHACVAGFVAVDEGGVATGTPQPAGSRRHEPDRRLAALRGNARRLLPVAALRGSLEHPWLHALVHVHFLVVGCLFLWPLVGVDVTPHPLSHGARLLVVLVAVPFHAFFGVAPLSTTAPLAPSFYPSIGTSVPPLRSCGRPANCSR